MANNDILQRIDKQWQLFLISIDGLTDDETSMPGVVGKWSVKDVCAHLA